MHYFTLTLATDGPYGDEPLHLISTQLIPFKRNVLGSSPFCCHTHQLFIDLKLLKVSEIISTQQLKLIFEFRNNRLPSGIQTLFTINKNLHKYQTTSSYNEHLCIPKIQTTTFGCKPKWYQGPSIWNQLVKKKVPINQSKSIKNI